VSDPLTSLVKAIDAKVHEAAPKYTAGRKLGTFVIIGDANGRAEQLRGLAKTESLQHMNLCIGAAPPRYELNPQADITVVIYTPGRPGRQEVVANFALYECELVLAHHDILTALTNVLPK
jgi:hypothetical protein